MKSAAETIIEKCGGHAVVADLCGVHISRVFRWTYSKERGGTGGLIPTRHQADLLTRARARGIDLSPSDFFPASHDRPALGSEAAA